MRWWAISVLVFLAACCGCGDPGSLVQQAPTTEPAKSGTPAVANDSASETDVVDDVVADSLPQDPAGEVQIIGFDDLNLGMPEDARFRPMMLEYNQGRTKELLGAVISIGGHMNPPDQLRGLTEFVLLKNKDCKFGPGGQADHLARVYMKKGTTVDYTDEVIYVEGKITLNPFPADSPMTWSIYDIEATKVSTRPPSRQR